MKNGDRTYAKSARGFRNVDIDFMPVRKNTYYDSDRVTVVSKVKLASGSIEVDYKLYWSDPTWKIYDFTFSGISFLKTYREQLAPLFAKQDLGYVIQQLEEKIADMNHD